MDLQLDFYSDWIALVRAELVNLGYTLPAGITPRDVALLYFNAVFRRIPKKPRRILKSRQFHCPGNLQAGLDWLEQKIAAGDDLNPHLSRKIRTLRYDDALLNDWGIFHFHLGTAYLPNGLVQGTEPVLFARVTDAEIYELCTAPHGTWADVNLIEILHANWPESIMHHRLEGTLLHGTDTNTIQTLRRANINAPVQTQDGTIYRQLGGGYATDGTSTVVVMTVNKRVTDLRHLEKWVRNHTDLFENDLKNRGYAEPAPVRGSFVVDEGGWYVLFPEWNCRTKLRPSTARVL